MAKATVYYSAQRQDVLIVVGDGLEEGNYALCANGTKAGDNFTTKEQALAALPDMQADISSMGFLAFLIHGGQLNADAATQMPKQGYENISEFEVEDVG